MTAVTTKDVEKAYELAHSLEQEVIDASNLETSLLEKVVFGFLEPFILFFPFSFLIPNLIMYVAP